MVREVLFQRTPPAPHDEVLVDTHVFAHSLSVQLIRLGLD